MAQRSSTTAFAKSTRPEIAGVVQREALFARLDGTAARTVVWVSAPPGYGKTTLVASYLEARSYRWAWYQVDPDDDDGETFLHYLAHATRRLRADAVALPVFGPEHRGDLAAFARRYFRALFADAVGPVAVVLDNLHPLSATSTLRTILEAGLTQVPRQCCVIVTSRAAAPLTLSRLQPGGQMVCLEAEDLKLTSSELAEMARLRGHPLAADATQQLQQRADGWAAALVLMVEHDKLASTRPALSGDVAPRVVFDYLAGEIFERFEPPIQRLLLQVACLPRITIDVARSLSGNDAAARVLFNLAHNDYFVRELVGQEGRVFVLHRLLREFLLHRAARDLPEAVDSAAQRRAAQLMRESGQTEDALVLLVECQDWVGVAAIAVEQADALLAQGRHATLSGWLELLPPALLAGDPALLHARGMALVHASPRVARRSFEEAFEAYRRRGDTPSMARCCVGGVDAVLQEFDDLTGLDRWLAEFDRCRVETGGAEPVPASIKLARLWREPGHPSIEQPSALREGPLAARSELARSIAATLGGNFARAAAIAAGIDVSAGAIGPAAAAGEALRRLVGGNHKAALMAGRRGLELSAAEAVPGFVVWLHLLCAVAALGQGDTESARTEIEAIEALPLRRGDRAMLHQVRSALARAAGEAGAALSEARNAAVLAAEAGLPWLECLARMAMAQLLAAATDRQGAEAQWRSAESFAQRLDSPLLQLASLFTQAAVAIECSDEPAAAAPLQAGFALARDLGLHHAIGLPSALMGTLCATALRRGIAVDHTRLLITSGQLVPSPAALRLRSWPWAFEVTTLGGFGLLRAASAIEFSAKGPGRPVELLKVLISMGGRNVRADVLADALWPHVDADYARKSFTATLHRLRRIFGGDETLKLRDGRLSLNDSLFWLDTWALDHLLAEIDTSLRHGDVRTPDPALPVLVDEVLALYRGPFLPDEAEQPAYIARREQLRARLLHALTRAARRWEESGRSEAAVDCYLRCIDADELCEAFYRNLMLCYQRHGNVAEALATYDRLQAVLAAHLKSAPSPETQALRATLRA